MMRLESRSRLSLTGSSTTITNRTTFDMQNVRSPQELTFLLRSNLLPLLKLTTGEELTRFGEVLPLTSNLREVDSATVVRASPLGGVVAAEAVADLQMVTASTVGRRDTCRENVLIRRNSAGSSVPEVAEADLVEVAATSGVLIKATTLALEVEVPGGVPITLTLLHQTLPSMMHLPGVIQMSQCNKLNHLGVQAHLCLNLKWLQVGVFRAMMMLLCRSKLQQTTPGAKRLRSALTTLPTQVALAGAMIPVRLATDGATRRAATLMEIDPLRMDEAVVEEVELVEARTSDPEHPVVRAEVASSVGKRATSRESVRILSRTREEEEAAEPIVLASNANKKATWQRTVLTKTPPTMTSAVEAVEEEVEEAEEAAAPATNATRRATLPENALTREASLKELTSVCGETMVDLSEEMAEETTATKTKPGVAATPLSQIGPEKHQPRRTKPGEHRRPISSQQLGEHLRQTTTHG